MLRVVTGIVMFISAVVLISLTRSIDEDGVERVTSSSMAVPFSPPPDAVRNWNGPR
jgi:hypothetical protein